MPYKLLNKSLLGVALLIGCSLAFQSPSGQRNDSLATTQVAKIVLGDKSGIIGIPVKSGPIIYPLAWPNGVVPFYLDYQGTNWLQRSMFQRAIDEFHRYTCVRFIPSSAELKPVVSVTDKMQDQKLKALPDNRGCEAARVGYQGPDVLYNVAFECGEFGVGAIQHQLMHKLGFFREEQRADRDKFLEFFQHNICNKNALAPFPIPLSTGYDVTAYPFDPDSVMQSHDQTGACRNHGATMRERNRWRPLGRQYSLTALDAQKINDVYRCIQVNAPKPKPSGRPSNPCTFDVDWCGYTQYYKLNLYNTEKNDSYADDFDWVRSNEPIPSRYRGLDSTFQRDHTNPSRDNGYYVIALSERHSRYHVAKIASPIFTSPKNGRVCLELFLFLAIPAFYPGNATAPPESFLGRITASLMLNGTIEVARIREYETVDKEWNQQLFDFYVKPFSRFQIILQAQVGTENEGDVAIDDVALYSSKCSRELDPKDLIRI